MRTLSAWRGPRRRTPLALLGLAVALLLAAGAVFVPPALRASPSELTIFGPEAQSLDPVVQADAGSAQVVAQIFESVTAIDSSEHVQPALAESWQLSDGDRRIVFHLRDGLAFSDGSPLRARDVVSSWLRLIDPSRHASLASLLDSVKGAQAYRTGGDRSGVAIAATSDRDVEVQFVRPAADFPAIVSSPTLAIVPSNASSSSFTPGSSFVASGGYIPTSAAKDGITLKANAHYWAGKPAIDTINLKSDIGGKSPVSEFQNGNLDYTPVSTIDASWIAYDEQLGPSLRDVPTASVDYYGFDTRKAPFNDVHVRRAFQMGVNWRSLVTLGRGADAVPATSMVPPGMPGRSDTDFGPVYDVSKAQAELAAAGYAGGKGFPKVTLVTSGGYYDDAIIRQLHDNLGIDLAYETVDFNTYYDRLSNDPPAFWSMGWVADYPGADDFLGMLLGTGKENNFGKWSSSAFDAAIGEALSASDAGGMEAGFDRAQTIVRDDAPVIPVDYSTGFALSRPGLLGAAPNGQGIIRYAGLSWASGQ